MLVYDETRDYYIYSYAINVNDLKSSNVVDKHVITVQNCDICLPFLVKLIDTVNFIISFLMRAYSHVSYLLRY